MGKPGAILLVGVGAFIMAMGWAGKLGAVWDVVRGGVDIPTPDINVPNPGDIIPDQPKPEKPQPSDTETPIGTGASAKCGAGRQLVVFRDDEQNGRCILAVDLAGVSANGDCDNRYREVIRLSDGLKMCARILRGAGAVPNDYAAIPLPTGGFARRYQPNVRSR
jgi:hypothetical protein